MKIVNSQFKEKIVERVDRGLLIDETIAANMAAQWLITYLTVHNKPFKVYNLGAGVKRITTETETCPCCKRKL